MQILAAYMGLLLVGFGWLVSFYLGRRRDRELEMMRLRLDHINNQLSQFYGQVYGLLLENDRVRGLIREQFGRQIVFEGGKSLDKDEEPQWVHYLENYFLPNNRRIINLLVNNVHLWEGKVVPTSFLRFLDYAIGFEALHKQYRDLGREYGFHWIEGFPKEFRTEIIATVSELKSTQWVLVGNQETDGRS